jgi:hypothetical protein
VIGSTSDACLFAAASFESRSITGPKAFADAGGAPGNAFVVTLGGDSQALRDNSNLLLELGFSKSSELDRFSARSLWDWTWRSVQVAKDDVVVDATCIPRELLAMLLFALSVRRDALRRVRILYTSPESYVTQVGALPEKDRWLSRGIRTLRTVVGYPGDFASERNRHVVALAGHEDERLLEIISFLEPTRLSISSEQTDSSTVPNANQISERVKARLRELIGHPNTGDVTFYADSIERTFESLSQMLVGQTQENVALVAMNTKLSFIGAALCALHLRHLRLVYAVPIEYNPGYSQGVGLLKEIDVTDTLMTAKTIQAH